MTIAQSFADFLDDNSFGVKGINLFINTVPLEAPKACWWFTMDGGRPSINAQTGERVKEYIISVFYRSTDSEDVDQKLHDFEWFINSKDCKELADFETTNMEALVFPSDRDLDDEDRTIGIVQVTVTVHQS